MTLKDSIKSDVTSVFMNDTEFAEPVVYKPNGGGSRSIKAIVDREPAAIYSDAGEVVIPSVMVTVRNCCHVGISAAELNTGGDRISLPAKIGDPRSTDFTILRRVYQDEGAVEIALK